MSVYDYKVSRQIFLDAPSFDSLIMAAIRRADSQNAARLRMAFPEVYAEVEARHNAVGGILPEDVA